MGNTAGSNFSCACRFEPEPARPEDLEEEPRRDSSETLKRSIQDERVGTPSISRAAVQAAARHAAAAASATATVVAAAAASVSSVAQSIHDATMSMVDARSVEEEQEPAKKATKRLHLPPGAIMKPEVHQFEYQEESSDSEDLPLGSRSGGDSKKSRTPKRRAWKRLSITETMPVSPSSALQIVINNPGKLESFYSVDQKRQIGFHCGQGRFSTAMWRLILSMLAARVTGLAVSLYCFTCATPSTYEVGMIAGMATLGDYSMQHLPTRWTHYGKYIPQMWRKLGLGMFECDGYDIISNVSADVLFQDYPEDHVHVIDMNLYVKKVKGPVGHDISSPATDPNSPLYQGKDATMEHLANTPVFKEVWSKIFKLGTFGKYDYTAKLDIDAVIVPERLSGMLGGRPDVAEYFQNAYHDMYGNFLHGPIELISRKGVYAFRDARHICFDKIDQMAFGEDFFAKQCWDMIQDGHYNHGNVFLKG
eukprot:s2466_g3.t1